MGYDGSNECMCTAVHARERAGIKVARIGQTLRKHGYLKRSVCVCPSKKAIENGVCVLTAIGKLRHRASMSAAIDDDDDDAWRSEFYGDVSSSGSSDESERLPPAAVRASPRERA